MKKRKGMFAIKGKKKEDIYKKKITKGLYELEWIPTLIMQAGKTAPKLYKVTFKEKGEKIEVPFPNKKIADLYGITEKLLRRGAKSIEMEKLPIKEEVSFIEDIWKSKKQIMNDAAETLVEQIKLGVTHKDVALRNILFYPKNGKIRLKLFDYGRGRITRGHRAKGHRTDYTNMGLIIRNLFRNKISGGKVVYLGDVEREKIGEEFRKIFENKINNMGVPTRRKRHTMPKKVRSERQMKKRQNLLDRMRHVWGKALGTRTNWIARREILGSLKNKKELNVLELIESTELPRHSIDNILKEFIKKGLIKKDEKEVLPNFSLKSNCKEKLYYQEVLDRAILQKNPRKKHNLKRIREIIELLELNKDGLVAKEICNKMKRSQTILREDIDILEKKGVITKKKGRSIKSGKPSFIFTLMKGYEKIDFYKRLPEKEKPVKFVEERLIKKRKSMGGTPVTFGGKEQMLKRSGIMKEIGELTKEKRGFEEVRDFETVRDIKEEIKELKSKLKEIPTGPPVLIKAPKTGKKRWKDRITRG